MRLVLFLLSLPPKAMKAWEQMILLQAVTAYLVYQFRQAKTVLLMSRA